MKIIAHTPVGKFTYESSGTREQIEPFIDKASSGKFNNLIFGEGNDDKIYLSKNILINSVFEIID